MANSKEAKARIKINKLLEQAGWRFFDNGKDDSIKEGETKYREEKLTKKRFALLGYEFIYLAGLLVILLSLLLLGFSVYNSLYLKVSLPLWFLYVRYVLAFLSFLPVALFGVGICLIKSKK